MYLAYSDEQVALRDQLREYFAGIATPELEEEMATSEGGGPHAKEAIRKMAVDGWLGIGWPVEYGGQGRSAIEQFIFYDEAQRAAAPVPFLTINTVGPALQQFGTDEQKEHYLPRILRGECFFSIGYTEPNAGTDLASLVTKGTVEGDELVISGQKIYTSLVDHADYVWLACRTSPVSASSAGQAGSEKHEGISIVIVPTDAEGFSHSTIQTMGEAKTFVTYYDDVRVPLANVVGGLGNGWQVIVTQLNYERVSLCAPGVLERNYIETRRWAQETGVVEQEWVRVHLARVHAKLEALRLINWQVAWEAANGITRVEHSSATKVYGTEAYCECYGLLLEVVGARGLLQRGTPGALLKGRLERAYRGTLILTFGGGTNEIQRDLIAMFGLKLPRSLR